VMWGVNTPHITQNIGFFLKCDLVKIVTGTKGIAVYPIAPIPLIVRED